MDPEQQLTFDAEGYVRMEDLPDVDPDTALAPAELARLHDALIGEQPPDSLLASWDAVVETVDELVPGDLADIVPNEPAFAPGPINLVDDGDQPGPTHTAERPTIGEPDASQTPDADGPRPSLSRSTARLLSPTPSPSYLSTTTRPSGCSTSPRSRCPTTMPTSRSTTSTSTRSTSSSTATTRSSEPAHILSMPPSSREHFAHPHTPIPDIYATAGHQPGERVPREQT